jgi:hypothetical protein
LHGANVGFCRWGWRRRLGVGSVSSGAVGGGWPVAMSRLGCVVQQLLAVCGDGRGVSRRVLLRRRRLPLASASPRDGPGFFERSRGFGCWILAADPLCWGATAFIIGCLSKVTESRHLLGSVGSRWDPCFEQGGEERCECRGGERNAGRRRVWLRAGRPAWPFGAVGAAWAFDLGDLGGSWSCGVYASGCVVSAVVGGGGCGGGGGGVCVDG